MYGIVIWIRVYVYIKKGSQNSHRAFTQRSRQAKNCRDDLTVHSIKTHMYTMPSTSFPFPFCCALSFGLLLIYFKLLNFIYNNTCWTHSKWLRLKWNACFMLSIARSLAHTFFVCFKNLIHGFYSPSRQSSGLHIK